MTTIYLRPAGILPLPPGHAAETARGVLPLAGSPMFGFAAVEVIERDGKNIRRVLRGLGDFFDGEFGRHTIAAGALMDALTSARPRIAGLSLDRPVIQGIVNVTPDSFSDGGRHNSVEAAIHHGLQLAAEGAAILDIGGESTRPGSDPVPLKEELARVIPVIEGLRSRTDASISVDTRKAEVMRQAARAGADILNDVSALTHDPDALDAAAATGLPVILMHAQGDPKTMNDNPVYDDVALDVFDFLQARIEACEAAGIPRAKLIADPGIGFGKHLHHNVAVMSQLALYHGLGVPLLLGASRKKMIGQLCDVGKPEDRLPGSLASALLGIAQGVQIVRVHDVAATRQAAMVWLASSLGAEPAVPGGKSAS